MQRLLFHRTIPLAVLLLGIGITFFAYKYLIENKLEKDEARLSTLAANLTSDVEKAINVISYGLGGANGVIAASVSVEHAEWLSYVASRDLPNEFPGVLGYGFIEYVHRKDLAAFIKKTRADNQPNFEVKTSGDKSDLFIIKFLAPEPDNMISIGFDIGSEKKRREAAEASMISGRPTLTKRLQLLQDTRQESGFLFLRPVYKKGYLLATPEDRRNAIQGWVYAPFTLQKVIAPIYQRFASQVSLRMYEANEREEENLLFRSGVSSVGDLKRILPLKIGQQPWTMVVQPSAGFYLYDEARYLPHTVALVGILLSIVVSGLSWIYLSVKFRAVTAQLQEGEWFIQGILDSANLSIIVTEPNGIIRVFNRAASLWLGYSPEEVVGKVTPGIFHDPEEVIAQSKVVSERLQRRIEPGFEVFVAESREKGIGETEWTYIRKDGSRFPVSLSVSTMRNPAGEVVAYMGIAYDITERKKAAEALQESTRELLRAKVAAENATQAKGQFLANMSHEIRTPLTSIIGYSESLITDTLTPDEQAFGLKTIFQNGNHLLGVINDILDLSKIEAGKLDVEFVSVDLAELISDISNLMLHKANEKGLSLGFEYITPIPRRISTDPIRLKQILINLVGNAVKFTSVGGVKVNVSFFPDAQRISFAVIDTGPGLTEDQKGKLFQAFSQADTSITRKFGGSGLGLVISSELAQKLGGSIALESEPNKGSVFTLVVSTGAVTSGELIEKYSDSTPSGLSAETASESNLNGNVLVAEDGEDNRRLISFLLKKFGVRFKIVENGALAVDAIANGSFDLVLMDVQMPVMDGYTATKQIRGLGHTVPIIALTANAMKADVELAMMSGCTDFLGKPFTRAELLLKLGRFLGAGGEQPGNSEVKVEAKMEDLLQEMPEMITPVLKIIRNLPKRLDEILWSIEKGDLHKTAMVAHSLRGATSNIGLTKLSETLGVIEQASNAGDLERVRAQFNQLKVQIENARKLESKLTSENL